MQLLGGDVKKLFDDAPWLLIISACLSENIRSFEPQMSYKVASQVASKLDQRDAE